MPDENRASQLPPTLQLGTPVFTRLAWIVPAFVLAVAVSLAGSGWSTGDDTYIYMNYAKSLLSGDGYSYNGTLSTGVTSPAWLLLAGGLCKLLGLTVIGWKIIGALVFACAFVVILRIRRIPGLLVAVLLLNPLTLRWSSSGMENPLTMLFVALLFACYLSRTETIRNCVALLAPLSIFVRPELALLSIAVVLLVLAEGKDWRANMRGLLRPGLAGLVLFTAVAFAVDFHIIPQTAEAKGIFLAMPNKWYSAIAISKILFVSGALLMLCAYVERKVPDRAVRLFWASAVCTMALSGYLAYKNILVSTRYETSIGFPLLLAACLVLAGRSRLSPLVRAAAYAQLAISIALFCFFLPVKATDEGVAIGDFAQRAREIVVHAEGGPKTVALSEVGAFGYYSALPIADTVGLVSGQAMEFYRATGTRPGDNLASLEAFLTRFSIHYYVETFGDDKPIEGRNLRFTPLLETLVVRNNMTQFTPNKDHWRLYRVDFAERPGH
ncbi:hypothetical protein [Cupriavidus sp. BIS7]|uniref:hypothetical protein n=1 Tax=Cupriavidus sp. BIS7 TaxID=1217718 RepID=UPI0002D38443|nr:hypothetical protein [Cupriavidus sp. BIS7]